MRHRISVVPVPVPGWTLHRPVCACGWRGDTVRHQHMAYAQAREYHHLPEPQQDRPDQPSLFDL